MTNEEWEQLYNQFDTAWLLDAVKKIDEVRQHLGDRDAWQPPQIRDDLFQLHQLAMDVMSHGSTPQAQAMFDLASDLEMQLTDMIEALEVVQKIL